MKPLKKVLNDTELENYLYENLYSSYLAARKGKSHTSDVRKFDINLNDNLILLKNDILSGNYHPSPGIAFVIEDPVIREIFAAPFRDRVVHHLLTRASAQFWDNRFIHSSFSCRIGRGTSFGVQTLASDLRKVSQNYQVPVYICTFDISGFFMSIPRDQLWDATRVMLLRQFDRHSTLYKLYAPLWENTIKDDPTANVHLIDPPSKFKLVPREKSLFHQPPGQGLVIGNITSQILSNLYMNDFDHYVVDNLGYKYYGRYVDDFYIIIPKSDLPQLKHDIIAITNFLSGKGLRLHPRKQRISDGKTGVTFLGITIKPYHLLPGPRVINNARKAFNDHAFGADNLTSITSYRGLLKHYNSYNILNKLEDDSALLLEQHLKKLGIKNNLSDSDFF